MIKREIKITVRPTPEELAFVFCNMGNNDQARFFSNIADLVKNWDRPFCFQLQSLIDHPDLTMEGKRIMEQIGEYGQDT